MDVNCSPREIREELEKILSSSAFSQADRMRRFLGFAVERLLDSQTERLKESILGVEVFDRKPGYDPKTDPIVRIEARRLRHKLLEFYDSDGRDDRIVINLPKGGYVPTVEVHGAAPAESEPQIQPRGSKRLFRWLIAFAAVAALAIAAGLRLSHPAAVPPLAVSPVTTYPGLEINPSLSPDGKQVAFVYDGAKGNFDIYVKLIDTSAPVRLTRDPAEDLHPSWSPDGREIAFLRLSPDKKQVIIIPALGGAERVVAEFPIEQGDWAADPSGKTLLPGPTWSPDGRTLALAGPAPPARSQAIYLYPVNGGAPRQVTFPEQAGEADSAPVFSPRDDAIAFVRSTGMSLQDVFVQPLSGGNARRLTFDQSILAGLTWASDDHIVFASNRGGGAFRLWKIPASGGEPQLIPIAARSVFHPSASPHGTQLAFAEKVERTSIWRTPLGNSAEHPARLITSSRRQDSPSYSPDGKKIAFISDRSGMPEIWVCDANGANAFQLTHLGKGSPGTPRWSPDGRWIVFDSHHEGISAVYRIGLDGGAPRRVSPDGFAAAVPSWSRDGRWIYFGSPRSGSWQIWKISTSGGAPVQVTRNGGFEAQEPAGGDRIYYTRYGSAGGIWTMPIQGGEETPVGGLRDARTSRYWTVAGDDIYLVIKDTPPFPVEVFHPATGRLGRIFSIAQPLVFGTPGLTVSPDGRWILHAEVDQDESDILLVENVP